MVHGPQLANELGVSTTALSQIVNGKGRYAAATRARVLARVREIGYAPHAGARAARLQRFDTLAVFNSQEGWLGQLNPQMLDACACAAAERGRRLIVETVPLAGGQELERRSSLFAHRLCDGLLMNHHLPPSPEMRRLVAACGVPALWLNLDLDQGGIRPDDAAAAHELVQALVGRGRRRLAMVDFNHNHSWAAAIGGAHYSAGMRWAAVQAAAAGIGVALTLINQDRPPFAERVAAIRAVLTSAEAPDGLICYGSSEAQAALLAMAGLGIEPGGAVGLVQFAEQPEVAGRPLSTALIPVRELGKAAVAVLCSAIDAGSGVLPSRMVPFTYQLEPSL